MEWEGKSNQPWLGPEVDFSSIKTPLTHYPQRINLPNNVLKVREILVKYRPESFIPLDLSKLPKEGKPYRTNDTSDTYSEPFEKPSLFMQVQHAKENLTNVPPLSRQGSEHLETIRESDKTTFERQIQKGLQSLTKPPKTTPKLEKKVVSGLIEAFKTRNQLLSDDIPELQCTQCKHIQILPSHCFRFMVKQENSLYCAVCHYITDIPSHCDKQMRPVYNDNMISQLLRTAARKQQEFDFSFSFNLYTTALQHLEDESSDDNDSRRYEIELERAYCLHRMDRLIEARDIIFDIISFATDQKEDLLLASSLLHMADLCLTMGELEQVRTYIRKSTPIVNTLSNYPILAKYHLLKGIYFRLKGKYSQSQTNLLQSKGYLDGDADAILYTQLLLQLGLTAKEMGDYHSAIGFLTLGTVHSPEFDYQTSASLYYQIIQIALKQRDDEALSKYYDSLKMLYLNNQQNNDIEMKYKYATTLIQKHSTRMIEKAKALETFQDMLKNRYYHNFEQHIFLMVNIADLLLQELQAFENGDVLLELERLITRLINISRNEGSFAIYFQASILQAKLKMVQFDMEDAYSLLQELKNYTQEHALITEEQQVGRLQKELRIQITKMDEVSFRHQSLRERMKDNDINLYIQLAMNFIKDEK